MYNFNDFENYHQTGVAATNLSIRNYNESTQQKKSVY
jgi:hypothetical protein